MLKKIILLLLLITAALVYLFSVQVFVDNDLVKEESSEYILNDDGCEYHDLSTSSSPEGLSTANHVYLECPDSNNQHLIAVSSNSRDDFGAGIELKFSRKDTSVSNDVIKPSKLIWESDTSLLVYHDYRLKNRTGEYGKYTIIFKSL